MIPLLDWKALPLLALTLFASLAVVALERLSDLNLSHVQGDAYRQQVLQQDEWRATADADDDWRNQADDPRRQSRMEFGYERIREHERVQEMLDQDMHSFDPHGASVIRLHF